MNDIAKTHRQFGLWDSPITPVSIARGTSFSDLFWDQDSARFALYEKYHGKHDRYHEMHHMCVPAFILGNIFEDNIKNVKYPKKEDYPQDVIKVDILETT